MLRIVFLVALAVPAAAQDAPACEVTASSAAIRIAVCDGPGSDAQLAAEGRRACDGALPCGAWFWADAEAAPAEAPGNHDGLTQEQIVSSLGVYVAENESFVRIEAVPE